MVVRCSVHLHGEAADAAGAVVTRCSVHEPLTYEALRAVYPFAGRFHFRVRRKLEGEDVWYDVREGEVIELDGGKHLGTAEDVVASAHYDEVAVVQVRKLKVVAH